MEGSFEVIGDKASDSLTLPRFDREDLEWINRNEWCVGLVNLNSSVDKANDVLNIEKRIEILETYRKKGVEAAMDNAHRRKNPNVGEDDEPEEGNRKVTFIVDQPEYSSALGEVIKSLETLLRIRIDTAPRRNIENIIKIILAICIEFNIQMQNAQETIKTMAGVIEELILQRYKIEDLEIENKKLVKSKEKLRSVNDKLERYNDHMREFSKPTEDANENRDVVNELMELKVEKDVLCTEIEKLKVNKRKREAEYNEVWGRKNHYKKEVAELMKRVDDLKEEMEAKKGQMDKELSSKVKEMQDALEKCNMWREECFTLREQIDIHEKRTTALNEEINRMKGSYKEELENVKEGKELETSRNKRLEDQFRRAREDFDNSMRKKDKEIEILNNRLTDRTNDLIGTKKEISNNLKVIKETRVKLNEVTIKNMELDNKMIGLKDEIEALKNPSVAEPEEPGPQKEVERVELKDSVLDSTYSEAQTTTGVLLGTLREMQTPSVVQVLYPRRVQRGRKNQKKIGRRHLTNPWVVQMKAMILTRIGKNHAGRRG